MKLAVAIATRGRPGILGETLRDLEQQEQSPDRILVCHTSEDDVVGVHESAPHVELVLSAPGSACQRNVLLRSLTDCDVILFLDDDFLMAPNYISVITNIIQTNKEVAVVTGTVIADGAKGPGFTLDFGRSRLLAEQHVSNNLSIVPWFNGYGCNMAIRMSVVREHGLEFDERLPLYAWYEDIDFTRRVGRYGTIVKSIGARGVHLGTKSGRTSGRRLGYSQVANPIYLARKGSFPWTNTIRSVSRNIAMNAVLSFWPEPFIDRRGRLWGNTQALIDLLKGSMVPERVLEF
jgi:GT2 family glycosyltransferase